MAASETFAKSRRLNQMNNKKLATVIYMVSGVAMLVWGVIANDWSKCWLCVVVGGVIGTAVGMLGDKDKK